MVEVSNYAGKRLCLATRIVLEFRKARSRDNADSFTGMVNSAKKGLSLDLNTTKFIQRCITRAPGSCDEDEEKLLRHLFEEALLLWEDLRDNRDLLDQEIKRRAKNPSLAKN